MIHWHTRLLFLTAFVSTCAFAEVRHSVGTARDIKTGNLRYIEHHQWLSDGSHRIDYYTPGQEPIAYKSMTFPDLPQHPNIVQTDYSRSASACAESLPNQIRVTTLRDGKENEYFLTKDPALVLDAGFDAWIKDNWVSLLEDGQARLNFAIVGVERTLAMNLSAEPKDGGLQLRITPANWFVALVVPKMDLYYDSDRRLTFFEGYSNLVPSKNEGKILVIDYQHYQTSEALTRPPIAWLPQNSTRQE